jgi:hypothetical protein
MPAIAGGEGLMSKRRPSARQMNAAFDRSGWAAQPARPPKQARLPLRGYTLCDNHPRDHIYRELARLGTLEEAALARYDEANEEPCQLVRRPDGTWEWEGEEEVDAAEAALTAVTTEALTFYQTTVLPILADWWL